MNSAEESGVPFKPAQADIYSLGIILFLLYFGNFPFTDRNYYTIFSRKPEMFFRKHSSVCRVMAELKLECLDAELVDLLQLLCSKDLTVRPRSIDEVRSHKFFSH